VTDQQPDYPAILRGMWRRHKRLVALTFLGLAVPLLALVYAASRPLFEASATVVLDTAPVERLPYFRDVARDNSTTHALVLKSRALSEAVIEALPKESLDDLLQHPLHTDYAQLALNRIRRWLGRPVQEPSPQARALGELRSGRMEFLPVEPVEKNGNRVMIIKAVASSPRVAMDLVNTHVQALLNLTKSSDQEDAKSMRDFLEKQTQQVREQLAQSEVAVTRFQQQKGRLTLGSQSELDLAKLTQAEAALAEAKASRQFLAARAASLRQVLSGAAREGGRRGSGLQTQMQAFARAQDRLQQLENKLADLRERYTEAHPLVQVTLEQVTSEQGRLARMARELPSVPADQARTAMLGATTQDRADLQRQLVGLQADDAGLQKRIDTLEAEVVRLRSGLRSLSREELQFGGLLRNVEAQRNLLTVFQDKLMAARIRDQANQGAIRIIDAASFPLQASHARTVRYALMVLALSAGLALLVAGGVEFWHQPLETETDVRKTTGLPTLGCIGTLGPRPRAAGPRRDTGLPLIVAAGPGGPGVHVDLYRAIRATIETECLKEPFRSILISSPGPAEGKSTTTLNLAHVFQEFGRRVLVVDADLRRPSLHRALGLGNTPGLVDALTGSATFEQVARPLPSGVVVIPGQFTRQDAGSLLASTRLREMLAAARSRFDLVLVDSAPILAVPDNLLLLTHIERVILVARASHTSKRDLLRAQHHIQQADARILGVVLNEVHRSDVEYLRPRYRRYYPQPDGPPAATGPAAARARRQEAGMIGQHTGRAGREGES
jgi:capsular exopolysaccharide synthesis family protein